MQPSPKYLSLLLLQVVELLEDGQIQRLARQDPKVNALIRAVRTVAVLNDQISDALVRERADGLIKAVERSSAMYHDIRRVGLEMRYSCLEDRCRDLEHANSFANYKLGEAHAAIAGLQGAVKRKDNLIRLRDIGLDYKDEAIAKQKRALEEWEAWGRDHGWTPQDFGYQPLSDGPTATAFPQGSVNRLEPAGVVLPGMQQAPNTFVPEYVSNAANAFVPQQSVHRPALRYEHRTNDEDMVPDLTDDFSDSTSYSDFTLFTERDIDDDDAAAWSFVDDRVEDYWE